MAPQDSNCMNWPEDIIIDILTRLPHKTLHRFKCVSKQWLAIISFSIYEKMFTKVLSGFFYNKYSILSSSTPTVSSNFLSLPTTEGKNSLYNLNFMPSGQISRVRDCANGLILYEVISVQKMYQNFYVCNPATKKWASLPLLIDQFSYRKLALAFDPNFSTHYYVLNFPQFEQQSSISSVTIYNSSTKTWGQNIAIDWMTCRTSHKSPGVFIDGFFYMLDRRHFVIKIGVKEQRVERLIPVPICRNGALVKCGDNLVYVMLGRRFIHVQIFEKGLDKFVWKCSAELQRVFEGFEINNCRDLDVVGVHLDLDLVFFQVNNKLILLHMKSYWIEELFMCDEEESQLEFFSYSPSLSSVL